MYRTGNHRHLLTGTTSEFLTVALMKLQVRWDVTPCHLVKVIDILEEHMPQICRLLFTTWKELNIIETFEFSDLWFLHISAIPYETYVTVMHYTYTDNSEE